LWVAVGSWYGGGWVDGFCFRPEFAVVKVAGLILAWPLGGTERNGMRWGGGALGGILLLTYGVASKAQI
jgi:hypothetical protein